MLNLLKSIIRITKAVFFSIILICFVTFMVNNRDVVTLQLFPLGFELETKVFVLIIISFLLGLSFGAISCSTKLMGRAFSRIKEKAKKKPFAKIKEEK